MTPSQVSKQPSWDHLLSSIANGASHPEATAWDIYYYLRTHYVEMGSKQARTLLAAYIKLKQPCPMLVNSCMLGLALKVSGKYDDFNLPNFLKAWGYDRLLRTEDRAGHVDDKGKMFPSLKDRTDRAIQTYWLRHPSEGDGSQSVCRYMYAVKVFGNVSEEQKEHAVKLVAADGSELVAESFLFPCPLAEIQGNVYEVVSRKSGRGDECAVRIRQSDKVVDALFPVEVGFIDGIDMEHGHWHVYDSLSSHFVADSPMVAPQARSFVRFCPIIPQKDRFKSAAILQTISFEEGCTAFGLYEAVVTEINMPQEELHYHITSPIQPTPEGQVMRDGWAYIGLGERRIDLSAVKQGTCVKLLLYLRREADNYKHNYVAEIIL